MARMRQLKITKQVTNRDEGSLDKYLQEIGRIPLITADEEVELARRIKEGDTSASEKLARANLRFVVSVAKQYQGKGLSLPDLINEGNLGLMKAVERFDETRGFKFISYAVWWIRQQILQSLADKGRIVRLPNNKIAATGKVYRAFHRFEQDNEREPNPEELIEPLGMTLEEIEKCLRASPHHISLDEPIGDSGSTSQGDLLLHQEANQNAVVDKMDLLQEIERALILLPERSARILVLNFGLRGEKARTLEEVGQEFEITREAARQIKEKSLRYLRRSSKSVILRRYLSEYR